MPAHSHRNEQILKKVFLNVQFIHMYEESKKKLSKYQLSTDTTPPKRFEMNYEEDFENDSFRKYKNKRQDETLMAQLQIARKTCKMQEEEFEFQRKELEEEINNRKKIEKQLRHQITRMQQDHSNDSQMYDVLVKMELEKKKLNDTQAKAAKWKERSKAYEEKNISIACQTKLLEEKVSHFQNQINEIQSQLMEERKAHEATEKLREDLKSKYQEMAISFGNLEKENQSLKCNVSNFETHKNVKTVANEFPVSNSPNSHDYNQQNNQMKDEEPQFQQLIKNLQNSLIERDQMIDKQKKEIEKLKSIIKINEEQVQHDKESSQKLQNKLKHSNKKLGKLNEKFEIIKKENTEKEAFIKKLTKKCEHLNSDFERNMKEISQLAEIEKLSNERLEQIKDIEEQLHKLNSLTGSKEDDIRKPWTNLTNKINEINKVASRVSQLEKENHKLNDHLVLAIGQLNGTIAIKQPESIVDECNDEYPRALQTMLTQVQNRLEHTTLQLEKNKLRTQYAVLIEKQNSKLVQHINDLHSSIFLDNDSIMRPLILSVIFSRRMLNIVRQPNCIDPKALTIFAGRQKFSMESRLREIRNKFTSLTQDLLLIKHDLNESKLKQMELNSDYTSSLDSYNEAKASLDLARHRMEDLQKELSTLVSLSEFSQALQTISNLSFEKEKLEKEIDSLNDSFEKQRIELLNQKNKCKKFKRLFNTQKSKVKKLKFEIMQRNENDSCVNEFMKRQTEDIESLEKMLKKSRKREAYTKLNSMNQIPSDHICGTLMDYPVKLGSPFSSPAKLHGQINPEFLGDKE